jgi:hypothetical protein
MWGQTPNSEELRNKEIRGYGTERNVLIPTKKFRSRYIYAIGEALMVF